MADSRDPEKVGWEWAAWWALKGDEPIERVQQAAVHLQARLGTIGANCTDRPAAEALAAAQLFIQSMAELLDENGTSEFKATIARRKAGKPINRTERARKGWKAAALVQRAVDDGQQQESAVYDAMAETGLSRAEVFAWLKAYRHAVGNS